MEKLLNTLMWLFWVIAIFLMLLYLNVKIGALSLTNATNFVDAIILSRFPTVYAPVNFYMGIASLFLGLSIFLRISKEKYFVKPKKTYQNSLSLNKLARLKVCHYISSLLCCFFGMASIATFYLIDFNPLLTLNEWILTHFLDNQKNKLALFYMIHGFLFMSISGFIHRAIAKQTENHPN